MIHKFIKGTNAKRPTLLLLHGTGGTENDLLPIAQMLDHEANILSLRGDVIEQGMSRFFQRLSPGVFDYDDIEKRVSALLSFLDRACVQYDLDRNDLFGLGYSNGANMLAQVLLKKGGGIQNAILLHPMDIDPKTIPPHLHETNILITAGDADPIVSRDDTLKLEKRLLKAGAHVTLEWFKQGHQVSREEVQTMLKWYKQTVVDPESTRD